MVHFFLNILLISPRDTSEMNRWTCASPYETTNPSEFWSCSGKLKHMNHLLLVLLSSVQTSFETASLFFFFNLPLNLSHLFSVTWSLTLFSPSLCSQKAEGTTTLVHSSFALSPLLMPQVVDLSYHVLHYCTKVKGVFIIIHLTEPANLFVVTDSQLDTFPSQLLKDSLWWHLQTHNFTEPGRESESPCHTRSAVKFTQLVTQTAPPPPVPSPLVHSPGHRPLSQVLKYGMSHCLTTPPEGLTLT